MSDLLGLHIPLPPPALQYKYELTADTEKVKNIGEGRKAWKEYGDAVMDYGHKL